MQVLKKPVIASRVKTAGRLILGLLLIAVLLYYVDWRNTFRIILNIDAMLALLALTILPINMWISTWKWLILLNAHDLRLPWNVLLRVYWIGAFFSNYFPSNIGGDIVRILLLRHLGRSAEVAASVVLERVTGLLVLLILAAVGLAVRPEYFDPRGSRVILWLVVVGGIATLVSLILLPERLNGWLSSLRADRLSLIRPVVNPIKKINSAIAFYQTKMKEVAFTIILSLPFYGIITFFQYFLLLSLDAEVALWQVALIAPVVLLVALVPISINGLGIVEGAFVLFYTNAGVLPEAALAAALLRRVFSLLVSLVGGIYWATTPREARADLAEMQSR